jgi:hypothetical protein
MRVIFGKHNIEIICRHGLKIDRIDGLRKAIMKLYLNSRIILLAFFAIFSASANAQVIDTNIQGLVIKNYRCDIPTYIQGNLVNRNSESFTGFLRAKIIDKDNDILWQGVEKINVGGQNGASFMVQVKTGTCLAPNKVQITLER